MTDIGTLHVLLWHIIYMISQCSSMFLSHVPFCFSIYMQMLINLWSMQRFYMVKPCPKDMKCDVEVILPVPLSKI